MKRIKWFDKEKQITLYQAICDIDNIRLAHKKASRGKRWYKEVKMVDSNPDYYLAKIQEMLVNHTYKVSEYDIFEKNENGKIRKIYKLPYYPDRIIQWAIVLIIGPILEKKFIKNTYSSIKKRGQHKCLKDVRAALRRDKEIKYCLKIDIQKFYPSIDQNILKNIYSNIFKDKELLQIIFDTICSVPAQEGIPIGNYLSQYSGNLYLTWFDHWIKEKQYIKYYFRYMDDMVFLSNSKKHLRQLFSAIKSYLQKHLKLKLKQNYQIFPSSTRGIDFVGYRIFPKYCLVRRKIVLNFKKLYRKIKKSKLTKSLQCAYMSYRGLLIHANSYNLRLKYQIGGGENVG